MHEENLKKNIRRVMGVFLVLFLLLLLRITYLQIFAAPQLVNHPLNRRGADSALQRGRIFDRSGAILAESRPAADGGFTRVYPQGAVFAHVTGYDGARIGRAGIESACNDELSGRNDPWRRFGLVARLAGSGRGRDIRLTVDAGVQRAAFAALGGRRGAVVVLDAATGAVLAMVSKPSFDVNALEARWDELREKTDSPLLNRAAQGLYPPGSAIKPLVADAALREGVAGADTVFDCPGSLAFGDDYTMYESDFAAHGAVNLEEALAVSCNVTFAKLTLQLGPKRLEEAFRRFGFPEPLHNELEALEARLPDFAALGGGELAQVGIGQGTLLTTPLRMALLASAVLNGGAVMKPHLIDAVLSPDGETLRAVRSEKWLEATTPDRAASLRQFMRRAVTDGTARRAAVAGVEVIGKTGTAENSAGAAHAWFIGGAVLPERTVAFAVIVENGGGGGRAAAPITREIIVNSLMN